MKAGARALYRNKFGRGTEPPRGADILDAEDIVRRQASASERVLYPRKMRRSAPLRGVGSTFFIRIRRLCRRAESGKLCAFRHEGYIPDAESGKYIHARRGKISRARAGPWERKLKHKVGSGPYGGSRTVIFISDSRIAALYKVAAHKAYDRPDTRAAQLFYHVFMSAMHGLVLTYYSACHVLSLSFSFFCTIRRVF